MATVERISDRATRRSRHAIAKLGEEFRTKRVSVGLSQHAVAEAAGISRLSYLRIEHGQQRTLTMLSASRVAAVLGLDLSVRVYPGANPLRDTASLARLERILETVAPPLSYRTEVPLPQSATGAREQRAWDAMLFGYGRRTGIEMEIDVQGSDSAAQGRTNPPSSVVLV